MNAMLNINVRVASQQALAQLKQLNAVAGSTNKQAGTLGGTALNLNSAFKMGNLEKFGKNLQWTGRQLEYNFTLPLVLAGAASTKWALDNETAVTTIRKAYGAFNGDAATSKIEVDALRKSFELLSNRFGIQQKEVLTIAADWAQAGAAGVGLAKVTRLTMETMILGQEDAKTATEDLLTIQSAYRLNTDQLRQSLETLNAIQVTTAIDFGGLVDAVSRSAGVAKDAGIDIRHLGALIAALVPATGSAAAGGNALRTILSRLMAPTKQAADEMALFGINVADASWQVLDGIGRITALAEAYGKLSDAQKVQVASIIGSRWQINRLDILLNDINSTTGVYAKTLAVSGDAQKASAVYAQQLATVLSSTPQGFKILITNIQNALSKAILPLLPALTALLSHIVQLVTWFTNLSPNTQQLALAFLVLLAAVGPVARYIGSFTLLFTTLGKAVGGLRLITMGMTTAQLANLSATELQNVGFIHQYGLIGGLGRIIRIFIGTLVSIPFRGISFGLEAIWAGFNTGLIGAVQGTKGFLARLITIPFAAIGAAFKGMWLLAGIGANFLASQVLMLGNYLSGPFLVLMRNVGTWIATGLSSAAQAAMSAAGTAATFVVDTVAGGISVIASFLSNAGKYFVEIVNATESFTRAIWITGTMIVQRVWLGLVIAAQAIGGAIGQAWAVTSRAFKIGWVLAETAVIRAWYSLQYAAVAAGTFISAAWTATARFFQIAWVLFTSNVQRLWFFLKQPAALAADIIAAIWAGAARAAIFVWVGFTRVMAALPSVMAGIWKGIVLIWQAGIKLVEGLQWGWAAVSEVVGWVIAQAMVAPWTVALIAIGAIALALVAIFRDQIAGAIINAFNALPSGLKDSLMTVLNMIKSFAKAAAEWLSHINPFARHSPSLVDQVKAGTAQIGQHYQGLSAVPDTVQQAADAHNNFRDATSGLAGEKVSTKVDNIVKAAPGSADAVNAMVKAMDDLQGAVDAVNTEMVKQQNLVDDMQRQVDQDMKPFNDAIFENELAQKRLRLELLKLSDAGQSVDDLKNKMADLAGEIETARGQQADLRAAGAGSDILAQYDQQINALQDQSNAMQGQVSPIQKVQDELDKLRQKGEELNLQKDIQFDPQLKALDDQKVKLDELKAAYSDVNGQLSDMKSLFDSISTAAAQANSAASTSFNADQFAAGAGADFQNVGGDTVPGLGAEGGLTDIQKFNDDMQKELDNALAGMGSMDMFAPLKDMWNSAWGWIKDSVGPMVDPIKNAISDGMKNIGFDWSWDGVKSAFTNLGTLIDGTPLQGPFEANMAITKFFIDSWIKIWDAIAPAIQTIWEWIQYAGRVIGDELKNWAPMFDKFLEAMTHVYNVVAWFIKVILAVMVPFLAVIIAIWKTAWPVLREVIEPVFKVIVGLIRAALEVIRGVISFILDLINGDWGKAWGDILTIVDGVWDAIYEVIRLPVDLIMGLVKGLVEGIVGFFTWLWDVLVGHSIIPDMVNGIIFWFEFLAAPILAVWDAISAGISWYIDNVIKPAFDILKWYVENILVPPFQWALDKISPVMDAIGTAVSWVYNNMIKPIFDAIKIDIGLLGDAMSWLNEHIWQPAWDAIKSAVSTAWDGITSVIDTGINLAIDAFNFLARAVNAVADALHLPFHIDERERVQSGGSGGSGSRGGRTYNAAGNVIPFGSPGFFTNVPMAIVGEGRSSYDEFVIPTDPKYRDRALALYAQLGTRILDAGDILGGAKDFAGGALGAGKDFIVNAAKVAKDFWDNINDAISTIAGNSFDMGRDVLTSVKDSVVDWGEDQLRKIPGAGILFDTAGHVLDAGKSFIDTGGAIVGGIAGGLGNLNPFEDGTILRVPFAGDGALVRPRPGGTLINVAEKGAPEVVKPLPREAERGAEYNFYGNLEFPNITKPEDAKKFMDNLDTLARR